MIVYTNNVPDSYSRLDWYIIKVANKNLERISCTVKSIGIPLNRLQSKTACYGLMHVENGEIYQNGFQNCYCVLTLKLLVVGEPVDQLHHQRLKQLPCHLREVSKYIRESLNPCYLKK